MKRENSTEELDEKNKHQNSVPVGCLLDISSRYDSMLATWNLTLPENGQPVCSDMSTNKGNIHIPQVRKVSRKTANETNLVPLYYNPITQEITQVDN
jgi:hypothetical protein